MTSDIDFIDPGVGAYLAAHTTPPSEIEQRLIERTRKMRAGDMQIGHPQARFMAALTRILRPSLVVEIGTFTGYSSLVMAQALPSGGRLLACDVSKKWTKIARTFWAEAGVDDRIDLRIGPAADTLAGLPPDTVIDLAFIDADKTGYLTYFEEIVPRLAPTGVILVDNVLWDGLVVDPSDTSADTEALRAFNAHVVADPRVEVALLPVGDGLSFITRRPDGTS
ncbi:MAG: class I SAM-dependent methyltransferase [Actinomycetota bacterium]